MIRVGINARALTKPNPGGVSRYTYNLLLALAKQSTDTEIGYIVFGLDTLPEALSEYECVRSANEPTLAHSGVKAHLWEQMVLPRAIARHDLDLFHTPAGQPPLYATVPLITTIHDISPITHPEWFSGGYAALYRVLTPLAVRASTRITTVSAFAKHEIETEYPAALGKTSAIHNGFTPPRSDGTPVEKVRDERFLLFVGAANRRKNLSTLLRSYRQYRRRVANPVSLVLAGPERDIFSEESFEPTTGVKALGFVSDSQLDWLYHHAVAFVFPSLYEGFGLPILEAMSAGTPVITSNRGAMAEVAGEAAHLVDPSRPERITDAIERVVTDNAYHRSLTEAGRDRATSFSWKWTAEQTIEVYRTVLD